MFEGDVIFRLRLFFIVRTQLGCRFKGCWMGAVQLPAQVIRRVGARAQQGGYFKKKVHLASMAAGAGGDIDAGQPAHQVFEICFARFS